MVVPMAVNPRHGRIQGTSRLSARMYRVRMFLLERKERRVVGR